MAITKRRLVNDAIERAITDTLRDIAWQDGTSDNERQVLKRLETKIRCCLSMNLVYDKYRWLELCDVMAWRKRAIEDKSTD